MDTFQNHGYFNIVHFDTDSEKDHYLKNILHYDTIIMVVSEITVQRMNFKTASHVETA